MHSSRMRTGRSLTVFRGLLLRGGGVTCLVRGGVPAWSRGGVYLVWEGVPAWSRGGVPGLGGYLPGPGGVYLVRGVYLPGLGGWGCTCLVLGGVPSQVLPPVNRMTDRCKNITLAKTSFRPVKMFIFNLNKNAFQ